MSEETKLPATPAVASTGSLCCIGVVRGEAAPTEDGEYMLDASKSEGWTGPSGHVEIVTHVNSGKPWPWCYWLPDSRRRRPRCGIPLQYMRGAMWVGPLQHNEKGQR